MGLAESMIENGITKGKLTNWTDGRMCLVGHAAHTFLGMDTRTIHFEGTDQLWNKLPMNIREAIRKAIHELAPQYDNAYVWEFNDSSFISHDDILRVGKMVDERLNL